MPYVITDECIKCMNCSDICPVSCIHPAEGEAGLDDVPQLYIHPAECIDCGQCMDECPVDAIYPQEELPADKKDSAEINEKHFQ